MGKVWKNSVGLLSRAAGLSSRDRHGSEVSGAKNVAKSTGQGYDYFQTEKIILKGSHP